MHRVSKLIHGTRYAVIIIIDISRSIANLVYLVQIHIIQDVYVKIFHRVSLHDRDYIEENIEYAII